MAVENIIKSFTNWKKGLDDAIVRHNEQEGYSFQIQNSDVKWNLGFLGYVMQQYKAKTIGGVRQPVQAFERIINKQREEIKSLCQFFDIDSNSVDLGEIPTLSSVIPLSQQSHAPIFTLGAQDGIVGSQYTRVSEAGDFFHNISDKFFARLSQ